LPPPIDVPTPFSQVIKARRSKRLLYAEKPLDINILSTSLFHSAGVAERVNGIYGLPAYL
jgi:hypothetical protein